MILPFMQKFPWGDATNFEEKIMRGVGIEISPFTTGYKIHTIRRPSCKIYPGSKLHMLYGNRTKQRRQFNADIPELATCKNRQRIVMHYDYEKAIKDNYRDNIIMYDQSISYNGKNLAIQVDGKLLYKAEIRFLIENDGLQIGEFIQWFFTIPAVDDVYACIIHWTDFKY